VCHKRTHRPSLTQRAPLPCACHRLGVSQVTTVKNETSRRVIAFLVSIVGHERITSDHDLA